MTLFLIDKNIRQQKEQKLLNISCGGVRMICTFSVFLARFHVVSLAMLLSRSRQTH